ncbi:MAG: hypothetical protein JSW60_08640 [Thermoplasmatales archaeon]|nr:MAG: hypothetical protein JSW60_08640 [Thermoplasmatales archaeon]
MYLKYKQKFIVGITLLIVAFLIISGIFVAYYLGRQIEKEEEKPIEEVQYDLDAISPDIPQGLIFEILRMRYRGLLDIIMNFGTSWRSKPRFYFITNMDGLEYISKDVRAASGESQIFFETWDSMFQENKINRDAEEEQETSEVTLTIMERKKVGVLGIRSRDLEKEKIYLTYDYRTGRWDGDDSFNDSDGYGHYLGENYEIWFNLYQTDKDGDGIPYWTEVNLLKTNPEVDDSKLDPDNDGIPTTWEWKWGYNHSKYDNHSTLDPDQDGLENIEEYKMEKWFANPFSQDIYIEADGMEEAGFFDYPHIFWEESQQILIERFASHGFNVYIDDGWPGGPTNGGGELLTPYKTISQDSGMMLQFYNNHFSEERRGIFRYLVVAHSGGFCHPSKFNRYDTLTVATAPGVILQRGGFTPRARRVVEAAMVMHELGHSLGITPWNVGGCDNATFTQGRKEKQQYLEEWGNYRSAMNYYYIYDKSLIDYSDGTHGEGDINDWELLDLTNFQKESKVIEDPGFELPGQEEISFMHIISTNLRGYFRRS